MNLVCTCHWATATPCPLHPPGCTCNSFFDSTVKICPVHPPNTAAAAPMYLGGQTIELKADWAKWLPPVTAGMAYAGSIPVQIGQWPSPTAAVKISISAVPPLVVVTIDGIRFVTECQDKTQAIALAERVARALGLRWTEE